MAASTAASRDGNREYFYRRLDRLFPGLKEEYIRCYGSAYVLESPRNRELSALFHRRCEEVGMLHDNEEIFRYLAAFDEKINEQISIFG